MKIFFEETANGQRWIDIETNRGGSFDVVFKTQGFAPDCACGYGMKQNKGKKTTIDYHYTKKGNCVITYVY